MNVSTTRSCPTLLKLDIIGYMSTDGSRDYHSDLSQLKYLTAIPKGRLSFNLNHGIDKAVKRTTDDNDEKISLLLRFLLDKEPHLPHNTLEPLFITYRRTLISVMCSAFSSRENLRIMATLYNNCIYLCSLETEQDIQRRQSRNLQETKFCAWGYKFEQYMLSDLPHLKPNIDNPVIENEEFSIFYRSLLGKHNLLYGAQIDGLLAVNKKGLDPPKTDNTEENINYLRNNDFIELKTNREIFNRRQEQSFRKYKLLRCWCQCYLAGLKGLLVGFRNDDGIIQRTQWFDTQEIVAYCKHEWTPDTALGFLDHFLSFVKRHFYNQSDKGIGPTSIEFEVDGTNIKVNEKTNRTEILPEWYLLASQECKS
ncbi:decapping and exoribonuclease protein-like [Aphomia sociella]